MKILVITPEEYEEVTCSYWRIDNGNLLLYDDDVPTPWAAYAAGWWLEVEPVDQLGELRSIQ